MPIDLGFREEKWVHTFWKTHEDDLLHLFKSGHKPQKCANGLWKIETKKKVTYWFQTKDTPPNLAIIASFNRSDPSVKLPNAIISRGIVKWPGTTGYHASDLYNAILKDRPGCQIVSDDILSLEALNVWIRLLHQGNNIFIYNEREPNKLVSVENPEELRKVAVIMNDDSHRFVLSESMDLMRLKILAGIS